MYFQNVGEEAECPQLGRVYQIGIPLNMGIIIYLLSVLYSSPMLDFALLATHISKTRSLMPLHPYSPSKANTNH